jgi:hypothetical protein
MSKEIYTKEEVIKLLTAERTRAKDIAHDFYKSHEAERKAFIKFAEEDGDDFAQWMAVKHENLKNLARYIGNTISGSNGLTSNDETIEDRIRENLK